MSNIEVGMVLDRSVMAASCVQPCSFHAQVTVASPLHAFTVIVVSIGAVLPSIVLRAMLYRATSSDAARLMSSSLMPSSFRKATRKSVSHSSSASRPS